MRNQAGILLIAATALLPACDAITAPVPDPAFNMGASRVVASTNGGGHYLLSGVLDIKFAFGAVAHADGSAAGQFRQSVILNGLLIEFHGKVTCVTFDAVNGRAWIGGVITANMSEDPAWQGGIFAVGKDVWFRVLDGGEGANAVDRSTFLGFEGGGGIITSAEYCAAQIWPAGDARTHPVTSGNIQVRS